jgi:hypothetical protein
VLEEIGQRVPIAGGVGVTARTSLPAEGWAHS